MPVQDVLIVKSFGSLEVEQLREVREEAFASLLSDTSSGLEPGMLSQ